MYAKLHKIAEHNVLGSCDKELLGKTFEEGNYCIAVKESFYRGKLIGEKELSLMLDQSNNINLIGEKSVAVALKKGIIGENDIIRIKNIPHVQIFRL